MKQPSSHQPASEDDRLHQIVYRFETAWQDGTKPSVEHFLPEDASSEFRLRVLRELVAVDLEYRLKAKEDVRIESYLSRYQELAEDEEAVLYLIAHEHELRGGELGESIDEYAVRFPTFCEQLPKRLSLGSSRQRRVRLNCPHCDNPIVIVAKDDDPGVCSICGGSFDLQAGSEVSWSPERLPKLDKFQLLEQVGRGAFGTVYRAKDLDLDRTVAIKIPRSGRFISPDDEDRFAREARNVAQLSHPGIVAVYEVGRTDDFPYIVAEFVDGVTLDEVVQSRKFQFRETAAILANLADALQHAHDRGVVHRDLKPANVMLQPQVNRTSSDSSGKWSKMTVPSVGRPRLMDFGLARREGGEVTVTMDGQVLGTPAYMSPEQARGDTQLIDQRSDVYSLGVMLYEILSGELPFRGTIRMMLHQVVYEEPTAPRKFNSHVPFELDTICLKCMEKEPSKRYQSAGEFADELRHYLNGEPIHARPLSTAGRAWRWCRRNPAVSVLSACLAAALAAGIVGITTQWLRAERHATEATRLAQQESEARSDAERKAATLAEVNGFLNEVLGSANPDDLGRDVSVREAVDRSAERIEGAFEDNPGIEAAVRLTLGMTYRSLSALDEAVFHFRKALALYEKSQGPESLDTLDAMNLLAGALRSRKYDIADVTEAESLRRRVLEIRKRVQGPDHPDTFTAMGNLGNVLSTAGREVEAIELFKESLRGHTELFGADSQVAITDRHNLASALLGVGEKDKAEQEFRRLYDLTKKWTDPDALHVRNMYAGALRACGKLNEAKAMYLQTLALRDDVLGPKHLHTLSTLRRTTRLLIEMEEFEEVLPLLEEQLRRHDDAVGFDAGQTLEARENLAITLEALKRFDEAEQILLKSYHIHKERDDQKYVADTRQQLIEFYLARGQSEKATALLKRD